jgi:hypothetical protein
MSLQRPKKTADEVMNATTRAIRKNDTEVKRNKPLSLQKHKLSGRFVVTRLTDMPGQVAC